MLPLMSAERSSGPAPVRPAPAGAQDPDAALVRLAQAGDEHAFARLVGRHGQSILALCYGSTLDHQLAEDVAQEVFIASWRGLGGFRSESMFSTWLHAIAHNACVNAARRRDARPSLTPLEEHHELEAPAHRATAGSEVLTLASELSPALRQTLLLREIRGLSYEEIAELQAVPLGTVRSRLSAARSFIADRLRG